MHVLVSTAGEKPKNVAGDITAPGPTAPVHHHAEGGPTLSQPASVDLLSLPWTATEDDIKTFVGVSVVKVLIVLNDYRKPSGNARVWLKDKEDVGKVLERNNQFLGKRRVEIRTGKTDGGKERKGEYYVRLDRLPWTVTEGQIRDFLYGSNVVHVKIEKDESDRVRGDAIVQVTSEADVENALLFHKQIIGTRNIDVTKTEPPRQSPDRGDAGL